MTTINLKCQCGSLSGVAFGPFQSQKSRSICMCDDCQAYAHYLGRASEILDENGGTEVVPMYPAHIKINKGIENLKCVRLSPEGMFRWYAGCCNTPIANTMGAKFPFAGVVHTFIDLKNREEVFGPIYIRFFGQYGTGPLPPGTYQKTPLKLIVNTMPFLLRGLLLKKQKPSPFFNSVTGNPVVIPTILSKKERQAII